MPCSAPTIVTAFPTTTTTGTVVITPPTVISSTVSNYTVTVQPVGASDATPVPCTNPTNCLLIGLTSGITYRLIVTATLSDGSTTSHSAPFLLAMPSASAPTLIRATAVGPTDAVATATPPSAGGPFVSYTFTAVELGTGSQVVATVDSPTANLTGLRAGSTYSVSVVAADNTNTQTSPSNTLLLSTPAPT